jgi:hypothetical protein
MNTFFIILLLVILPFAFGIISTIYLHRSAHLRFRTFESVEFVLLSLSVLVILVDFASYKENSELYHLEDEFAAKSG